MAQRIRSILVDNTLGKIFTGANSVSYATAANMIAGSQKQVKTVYAGATVTTKVANNLSGGNGISVGNNGVLTGVTLSLAAPAVGAAVTINLKKGSSYSNSSIVGTYSIPVSLLSAVYVTTLSFITTDNFYIDVTQVGSVKSGTGLLVQLSYYSGY